MILLISGLKLLFTTVYFHVYAFNMLLAFGKTLLTAVLKEYPSKRSN